jgi:leucyl aminopeptidase (aminopeptidase T)
MENQKENLEKAASILIKDLLCLKKGEKLLIYVDQGSDLAVAQSIQDYAGEIGVQAELYKLNDRLEFSERLNEFTAKIESEHYDAICELSEQYFYPTIAWRKALERNARIYSLAAMDAQSFIRCIGQVNHESMFRLGTKLGQLLKTAKTIHIRTAKGTDIKFRMQARMNRFLRSLLKSMKKELSYVMAQSGTPLQPGQCTFLGGQIAFQGIPGTIEGTAVVDGYLWPPKEAGQIQDPIILTVKKGYVTDIGGCPVKSKILTQWLEGKSRKVKHFCMGFHPNAKLSGGLTEAERVYGSIAIGFGDYPFHSDGIMNNPTIWVNDEILEQNGFFTHKSLPSLATSNPDSV